MNHAWWKIARVELKLAARDREAVIWSLIAPIAMAWLFGTMFKQGAPEPTRVALDRGDNPAYVGKLVGGLLERKGLVLTESDKVARVVLPDSLVAHLVRGDDVDVRVLKRKASDLRVRSISASTRQIMVTLAFAVRKSWLDAPPDSATVAGLVAATGPITVDTRVLGKAPRRAGGVEHQLPAMLVMFLLFQLTTFFMVLWVEDIHTGKIKRIVMSPTSMRDLFVGELVSRLVWGLVQVVVILGVGSALLGVHLDVPWGGFSWMLLAYMATAISLGLFLGTFFRTPEKANAVGVMTGLVLAALGGCWWPLEVVSDTMKRIAMVLPTGLMMDAVGEFIARGPQAPFPLLNFVALVAMTAVLMPLAIRRMHRQIVE